MRDTVALGDEWWVSASPADAVRAARQNEFNGDALELAAEPDNYPQKIALSDSINGLTPRHGRRDLPDAAHASLPPDTTFVHGGKQEEAQAKRRVPTPFLTYARIVDIPANWQDQTIFLHLDNTRYNVTVSINDRQVAHYVGGLEPHRIDITDAVHPGQGNLIEIKVGDCGTSGHRPFDPYDYTGTRLPTCKELENNLVHPVNYGGSDRTVGSVCLEAVPRVRVEYVFADPKVAAGILRYKVCFANDTDQPCTVHVNSEAVDAKVLIDENAEIPAKSTISSTRDIPWPDPILWDTDTPHLYELRTTLASHDSTLDTHRDTFGFREFTINGHSFYLNGKKIHLFNQSGHTSPDLDATIPLDDKIAILRAWKEQGNCNHIRLHAKPQHKSWVEAADRVGMLITTETALWTTGFHSFDWEGSEEACYQNVRNHFFEALVRRDRNSPSVVLWSLSNEMSPITPFDLDRPKMATMTRVFERILAEAREEDSSRVIQMSSAMDFLGRLDVYNLHYPKNWQAFPDYPHTAYWLDKGFLFPWYGPRRHELPAWQWRKDKPLIFGEFTCVFGATPDNQASVVGDVAFEHADFGTALVSEKLWPLEINAYRRQDVSGFCAWSCFDPNGLESTLRTLRLPHVCAMAHAQRPLAVLCHTYRERWFAGDEVAIELSIHNDTRHDRELALRCEVHEGDDVLWSETMPATVYGPAELRAFTCRYRAPLIEESKTLSLHAVLTSGPETVDVWERPLHISPRCVPQELPEACVIYDADGTLAGLLERCGMRGATFSDDLAAPGALDTCRTLIVCFGEAKLHAREWRRIQPVLDAFVKRGGCVVLDNPPDYARGDLPIQLHNGKGFADGDRLEITYAYNMAPHHPLMAGLTDGDFSLWGTDYYVARRCFEIPQEGNAVALLVAGTDRNGLTSAPLLELGDGKGCWLVSTLQILPKLNEDPLTRRLLARLATAVPRRDYGGSVDVSVTPDTLHVLREIGFSGTADHTARPSPADLTLIDGVLLNPADMMPELRAALQAGGTVYLHALSVEQTETVLAGLDLPGTVKAGAAKTDEFDTIQHTSDLADGMSSNCLYWIVDKSRVAPWTHAPLHPHPATALVALGDDTPDASALTRRGAVVVYEVDGGQLVIDALNWHDPNFDEPERPRRFIMTLMTNLGMPLTEGTAKRMTEEYETEAERRERGHF